MSIIECSSCGQKNDVDLEKLLPAVCGSCSSKLIEESGENTVQEVDINKWIVKIGDHEEQNKYVAEGFWAKVKKYASKVPFAKEVLTLYYCSIDPETPLKAKVTAVGALAYWIMPIDLIPDFIPVIGFVDDATAIFIAYRAISGQITNEHRHKTEQFFSNN